MSPEEDLRLLRKLGVGRLPERRSCKVYAAHLSRLVWRGLITIEERGLDRIVHITNRGRWVASERVR
jgi:hypothetical protein